MIDVSKIEYASKNLLPYQEKGIFRHSIPYSNFMKAWQELREIQKLHNKELLDTDQSIAFKRENKDIEKTLYIGVLNKELNDQYFKEVGNFISYVKDIFSTINIDNLKDIETKQLLMLFQDDGFIDLYDKDLKKIEEKSKDDSCYHTDPYEHIFIQLFGRTGWIFKTQDNQIIKILMEQGDIVFIPKGLRHVVYAFEKRASLTLMMEKI